ncbi:MAG: GNAT family N-acetyltransferase [Chloroflexota bacterium]|nr:GNAT family N-acetyltransferase [Chloroflexota bacterium]
MAGSSRDGFLIRPITNARHADFETLMHADGLEQIGCWDMAYRHLTPARVARREQWRRKGVSEVEGDRRDAAALIASGKPFGLLAYDGDRPIGFVSVGPRTGYPRVDASVTTQRVDDVDVWVVPCLFVRREYRGRRVTTDLLRGALDYAAKRGAPALEAYPRADSAQRIAPGQAWFGTEAQFRRAGFRKVRGVRPNLPHGWAPRVTMRATCVPNAPATTKTLSPLLKRSRAAS